MVVIVNVREKSTFVVVVGLGRLYVATAPAGSAGEGSTLSVTVQGLLFPAMSTLAVYTALSPGATDTLAGESVSAARFPSVNVVCAV